MSRRSRSSEENEENLENQQVESAQNTYENERVTDQSDHSAPVRNKNVRRTQPSAPQPRSSVNDITLIDNYLYR